MVIGLLRPKAQRSNCAQSGEIQGRSLEGMRGARATFALLDKLERGPNRCGVTGGGAIGFAALAG